MLAEPNQITISDIITQFSFVRRFTGKLHAKPSPLIRSPQQFTARTESLIEQIIIAALSWGTRYVHILSLLKSALTQTMHYEDRCMSGHVVTARYVYDF